jgi:hypothetical protein
MTNTKIIYLGKVAWPYRLEIIKEGFRVLFMSFKGYRQTIETVEEEKLEHIIKI